MLQTDTTASLPPRETPPHYNWQQRFGTGKLLRSGRPGLFLHGAYHRRKQRKRKLFSQSGLLKALVKWCCAILLLPKPGSALQHTSPREGWTKADQPRNWAGRKNAAIFISMKNYVIWATVPQDSNCWDSFGEACGFWSIYASFMSWFLTFTDVGKSIFRKQTHFCPNAKIQQNDEASKRKGCTLYHWGRDFYRFPFKKVPSTLGSEVRIKILSF